MTSVYRRSMVSTVSMISTVYRYYRRYYQRCFTGVSMVSNILTVYWWYWRCINGVSTVSNISTVYRWYRQDYRPGIDSINDINRVSILSTVLIDIDCLSTVQSDGVSPVLVYRWYITGVDGVSPVLVNVDWEYRVSILSTVYVINCLKATVYRRC